MAALSLAAGWYATGFVRTLNDTQIFYSVSFASTMNPRIFRHLFVALLLSCSLHVAQAQVVAHVGGGVSFGEKPAQYRGSAPAVHASGGVGAFLGPFLTVRSYIDYSRFSPDAAIYQDLLGVDDVSAYQVTGGEANSLAFMLDLKVNTPVVQGLSPYVFGGAGILRFVEKDAQLINGDEEPVPVAGNSFTGPVAAAGIGLNFIVSSRVAMFVEGRYQVGFGNTKEVAYLPMRLGFAFR
jgi:hypothetical protein